MIFEFREVAWTHQQLYDGISAALTGRVLGKNPQGLAPGEWLVALFDEVVDADEGRIVIRNAMETALRTGQPRHIEEVCRFAQQRPVVSGAALISALSSRHALSTKATCRALARALAVRLDAGDVAYDPALREAVRERWLLRWMGAVWAKHDPDWFYENLSHILSDDPVTLLDRLAQLRGLMVPEDFRRVAHGLIERGGALSDETSLVMRARLSEWGHRKSLPGVTREVVCEIDLSMVGAPASESEPWRGIDGRLFVLPAGGRIPPGTYLIGRAGELRGADLEQILPFEVRPR